jgi:hypothetical protein
MKQVRAPYFQVVAICPLQQKCTDLGCKVARSAKFNKVVLYILGSSLSNLDHVTFLTPRILRFLPDFGQYVQGWFKIIVPVQAT